MNDFRIENFRIIRIAVECYEDDKFEDVDSDYDYHIERVFDEDWRFLTNWLHHKNNHNISGENKNKNYFLFSN